MYRFAVIPCLAMSLSACGGSSTGTASYVSTLKDYNDGSGAVVFAKEDANGNPAKYALVSTDADIAVDVAKGTYALTATSAGESGAYYNVTREGAASNGAALTVVTVGENLNYSGSEYASISFVNVNNDVGLLSSGTAPRTLPSGTYVYNGYTSVVDSMSDIGDGTFSLTANFTTNTASLAASTSASIFSNNTAYFFSGSDMPINQTDGSFATSNGLIGVTGGASESASVKGYFAGTNAKGVHGIAYTNDAASPDLVGAFYGSR